MRTPRDHRKVNTEPIHCINIGYTRYINYRASRIINFSFKKIVEYSASLFLMASRGLSSGLIQFTRILPDPDGTRWNTVLLGVGGGVVHGGSV